MIFESLGEFIIGPLLEFSFGKLLNFIGGTARWIFGTTWRTIAKRPKFKFSEYINGPKKPIDEYDRYHGFVNIVIGIMVITGLILLIVV